MTWIALLFVLAGCGRDRYTAAGLCELHGCSFDSEAHCICKKDAR